MLARQLTRRRPRWRASLLVALAVIGGVLAARATSSRRLTKPIPSTALTEAAKLRASSSRPAGEIRLDAKGVEQVWVPAGCFRRGADPAKEHANPYETPQHDVCLTAGFWLDRYEVTHESFARFVSDDGYLRKEFWSEDGWRWKGS